LEGLKQKVDQLQIGWIPYWNLWPFKSELLRQNYEDIVLRTGVPTAVNRWLHDGEVTLAPCSSVCLVSHSNHEMALPLGVAADGPVQSVYLGLQREHLPFLEILRPRRERLQELFAKARKSFGDNERSVARFIEKEVASLPDVSLAKLPPLHLSSASATSACLTKLLYRLWFGTKASQLLLGRDMTNVMHTQRPVELLIGDEALCRRRTFHTVLDLGSVWKEMTGLPFVFAVWQSRGSCLNGWRRKILQVGGIAETKMRVQPSAYLPDMIPQDENGKNLQLADYWKNVYYRLGPREFKGLLMFLCLARNLQVVPKIDSVVAKIVRWQTISQSGALPPI